jgi:hypothetical protein
VSPILSYFQGIHEDTDLDFTMNTLVIVDRDPAGLDQEIAATVAAIQTISGK